MSASFSLAFLSASSKWSAPELMQYLRPVGSGPSSAAAEAAAVLQLFTLAVLAAGWPRRAVAAAALLFLLVEGLRAFQGRLDAAGAVSLTAALLLYVLRPARSRA